MNKLQHQKEQKRTSGWERVRFDVLLAIREHHARGRKLQKSLKAVEEKIRIGEPLPEYLAIAITKDE